MDRIEKLTALIDRFDFDIKNEDLGSSLYVNGKNVVKINDTGCFAWLVIWFKTVLLNYQRFSPNNNRQDIVVRTVKYLVAQDPTGPEDKQWLRIKAAATSRFLLKRHSAE